MAAAGSTVLTRAAGGVRTKRPSRPARPALVTMVSVLVVATLAELLLMRLFYRIGIFLPKRGVFAIVYRVGAEAGSFAFNLASILAAVALASCARLAWLHGRRRAAVAIGAILAAAAVGTVTKSGLAIPAARLLLLMLVVASCAAAFRVRSDAAFRLAIAGVAATVACSTYAGLASDAAMVDGGWPMPGVAFAQIGAEWLALATGCLLFAAWWREGGPRRVPIAVGALPAAALLLAHLVNGSVTGILALWTSGFRLTAPILVYLIALWMFASVVAGWFGPHPWRSLGLFFLLAGGLLPASSYGLMLVVLGLLFLTDGVILGGLPARRASSTVRDPAAAPDDLG